jgi:hypothetical protein
MPRPNEPGLYPDVPFMDYLSWEAVSAHDLMAVRRSPAHYLAQGKVKQETDAMRFGTAAHAWILQPDEAAELIMVAPKVDRRTKAGKEAYAEFLAEAGNRTIVNDEEAETLAKMAGAVNSSPAAKSVLDQAKIREASVLWRHPECWGRGRPDALCKSGLIVDLKTAQDASADAFARTCANFNYHMQAAYYIDGLHIANVTPPDTAFVFVVVEKTPPFGVAVYTLSDEAIELGRQQYRSALATYEDAISTQIWGGYTAAYQIETLDLPRWAYK